MNRPCPSNRRRAFAVCVLLAALSSPNTGATSLPDTIDRVKPSIVGVGTMLYTRRPPGNFGGTGFVVGDGRHAVTNAHVLPESLDSEKNEFLAVLVGSGRPEVRRAREVAVDRTHDLALLAFDGKPVPALPLGDSESVREGELYAFTGFPIGMVLGMRPVTHRGIVSSITPIAVPQIRSRELDPRMVKRLRDPYAVFQLDATAYPGNSGSPLYTVDGGVVVGVINKVFVQETKEHVLDKPSAISYAIPSRYVRALMEGAGLKP